MSSSTPLCNSAQPSLTEVIETAIPDSTIDDVTEIAKNVEKKKMTKEEKKAMHAPKNSKLPPGPVDPLLGDEPQIIACGILNNAAIRQFTDMDISQEELDRMFAPNRSEMLSNVIEEMNISGNPMGVVRNEYSEKEQMLFDYLKENAPSAKLLTVPSNYYDYELEIRRRTLGAPSIDHLCKTIIFENTGHSGEEGNDRNSRFYCVVVQYTQAKINCERIKDVVKTLNFKEKLGNRKLNFNFASEDLSSELSGYTRNAITPFCLQTRIPVILERKITELNPPMIWLGGGEIDSKIGISLKDFMRLTGCFVGDVLHSKLKTENV